MIFCYQKNKKQWKFIFKEKQKLKLKPIVAPIPDNFPPTNIPAQPVRLHQYSQVKKSRLLVKYDI